MSSRRTNSRRWHERRRLVLGVVAVVGLLSAAHRRRGADARLRVRTRRSRTARLGERELPASDHEEARSGAAVLAGRAAVRGGRSRHRGDQRRRRRLAQCTRLRAPTYRSLRSRAAAQDWSGAQDPRQLGRRPRRRPVGQPRAGQRGLSAQPVPEPVRLRAERVRRGRPHGPRRDRPELLGDEVPLLDRERGRRHLADGERARGAAGVGVPLAWLRAQQHRRARARPERLVERHDLRRHRRAEHLPQRLHRRRRHVQLEGRRQPLEGPDRGPVLQPAAASARSRSSRATRRRSSSPPGAHGSRGISSTCCTGVDRGAQHPGRPALRALALDRRRRDVHAREPGQRDELHRQRRRPQVFLGQTACSPRGARRVQVDPTDPNTVYASFFAKGIWRSNSNGDPGTWTQIFAPLAPPIDPATGAGVERAEFDVVALPTARPACTSASAAAAT